MSGGEEYSLDQGELKARTDVGIRFINVIVVRTA